MKTPISRLPAPTTYAREADAGRCSPSCCKTPYGHATAAGDCPCHGGPTPAEVKQAGLRDRVRRMKEAGLL